MAKDGEKKEKKAKKDKDGEKKPKKAKKAVGENKKYFILQLLIVSIQMRKSK